MLLKKAAALLIDYNPKDRNFDDALEFLNQNIKNINSPKKILDNYKVPSDVRNLFSKKEKKLLLKATFYSGHDLIKVNIDDYLFKGKFRKTDTINKKKVKSLIKKGLKLMEKSRDPLHDLSHIYRTIMLSRYIYERTYSDLDWGIIATSIVWHDISRVKYLGLLYKHYTSLIRFPLLQDLNIMEVSFKDALRSALLVKKFFKKNKMPKKFRKRVVSTIIGTDTKHFSRYSIKKRYQRFSFDVDTLDMFTIGRWESANRNVFHKRVGDKYLLNRTILLNFIFQGEKIIKKINLHESKKIFRFIMPMSVNHLIRFYPTDATFAVDLYNKVNS